jgi:hypothetical protein
MIESETVVDHDEKYKKNIGGSRNSYSSMITGAQFQIHH